MARITNYVDGNTLTGAQLNNEIDNIWNNGAALVNAVIPSVSIVQGLQGSIVSNLGSFQANGYQLRSTSGLATLSATSSYGVNTQTAGPVANGRDQAAAFASTTVHFYAITTGGSSTNAAGICSTKPPPLGPTLPAGYSAWAYLASGIYTVASSASPFSIYVRGSQCSIAQVTQLANGMATSATAFTLGARVPAIASAVQARLFNLFGGSTANGNLTVTWNVQPLSTGTVGQLSQTIDIFSSVGYSNATIWPALAGTLPLLETSPTLYYSIDRSAGVAVSLAMDVSINGYTVPNGDVG